MASIENLIKSDVHETKTDNLFDGVAESDNLNYLIALDLVGRGFFVIPLHPNSKVPIYNDWQKIASNKKEDVYRWFAAPVHADRNIGIVCKNIYVVDVDVKNGDGFADLNMAEKEYGPLSEKYVVITPSGGKHYYHRKPDGDYSATTKIVLCGKKTQIDARVGNALVVAPGSVIDGKKYEWKDGLLPESVDDLDELPQGWKENLPQKNKKPAINYHIDPQDSVTTSVDDLPKYETRLKRCRASMPYWETAVSGQGGQGVMQKAMHKCKNGFALEDSDAWDIILEYNERCTPHWDMADPKESKWMERTFEDVCSYPKTEEYGALAKKCNKQGYVPEKAVKLFLNKLGLKDDAKELTLAYEDEQAEYVDEKRIARLMSLLAENGSRIIEPTMRGCSGDPMVNWSIITNSVMSLCKAKGFYTPTIARYDEYGKQTDTKVLLFPVLYIVLLAQSSFGKSFSSPIYKEAMRAAGLSYMSSTASTHSALKDDLEDFPRRTALIDECSDDLDRVYSPRSCESTRMLKKDWLTLFEAPRDPEYTFDESRTERRDRKQNKTSNIIRRPMYSLTMWSTIDSYQDFARSEYGQKAKKSGLCTRLMPIVRTKLNLQKSQSGSRHKSAYLNHTSKYDMLPADVAKVFELWKDMIGSPDEIKNGFGVMVDNTLYSNESVHELPMSDDAYDMYHEIEDYCMLVAHKAGDLASDFFRMPGTIVKLATIYAVDRCEPRDWKNLGITTMDLKIAFLTAILILEEIKQTLYEKVEDQKMLVQAKALLDGIKNYVDGKIGEVVNESDCSRALALYRGCSKGRVNPDCLRKVLDLLDDFGNIRRYEDKDGTKKVMYLSPWSGKKHRSDFVNGYKTVDWVMSYEPDQQKERLQIHNTIEEYKRLNGYNSKASDKQTWQYHLISKFDVGLPPEVGVEPDKVSDRKNQKKNAALEAENSLLKEQNNILQIELDQRNQKRKTAQKSVDERIKDLEKQLQAAKAEKAQGSLFDANQAKSATVNEPRQKPAEAPVNASDYAIEDVHEEPVEEVDTSLTDAVFDDYEADTEELDETDTEAPDESPESQEESNPVQARMATHDGIVWYDNYVYDVDVNDISYHLRLTDFAKTDGDKRCIEINGVRRPISRTTNIILATIVADRGELLCVSPSTISALTGTTLVSETTVQDVIDTVNADLDGAIVRLEYDEIDDERVVKLSFGETPDDDVSIACLDV